MTERERITNDLKIHTQRMKTYIEDLSEMVARVKETNEQIVKLSKDLSNIKSPENELQKGKRAEDR
jgi:GTP:adenosylcobinamide-phosphate guanylyltransferase